MYPKDKSDYSKLKKETFFSRFRLYHSGESNAVVLSSPGFSHHGIWMQGRHHILFVMSCQYPYDGSAQTTLYGLDIFGNFSFFDNLTYLIFMPLFLLSQNPPEHTLFDFLLVIFLSIPFIVSTALFILHKIIRKKRVAQNENSS